jgi:hypothetical protein
LIVSETHRGLWQEFPAINAIVLVNPEAEKEANELDRRFVQSGLTGPLHCLPMIVKDNFETRGLRTTDGALAFASYIPSEDAFLVKRIKEAGALVLAKSTWLSGRSVLLKRSVLSCPAIPGTRTPFVASPPDRAAELRQPWPRVLAWQAWAPILEIPSAGLLPTRLWVPLCMLLLSRFRSRRSANAALGCATC